MSDVITTASGLKYEILECGSGATPGPTDTVSAHYHGTFEDGRVFDSSVERGQPIDLPVNGVITGWTEAFPCPADGAGCLVEFADNEFKGSGRDTVYYARAIEAPDSLIHGDNPLGSQFDEQGRCVEITPCGVNTPHEDDCLGEAEPRARSSPIFVNRAGS